MTNRKSVIVAPEYSPSKAKNSGGASPVHNNRLPKWLRRPIPLAGCKSGVEQRLFSHKLHTVCEEARCPNKSECFAHGTATFLIMGDTCTRNCRFCAIRSGIPQSLESNEPFRLCETVKELKLSYVVITSVTRDDLPDGGAGHFAATVGALRKTVENVRIELLIPDFQGNPNSLSTVIESSPDVLNHNIETVPRLYGNIRPEADYGRSLEILRSAYQSGCLTKSGLMVGVGETDTEIFEALRDIRTTGCSIITIGQYLQPSASNISVHRFVSPEQFSRYSEVCMELGFTHVFTGPFVRSSYRAADVFNNSVNMA